MLRSGSTAVMTIPHSADTSLTSPLTGSSQAPNFSRPYAVTTPPDSVKSYGQASNGNAVGTGMASAKGKIIDGDKMTGKEATQSSVTSHSLSSSAEDEDNPFDPSRRNPHRGQNGQPVRSKDDPTLVSVGDSQQRGKLPHPGTTIQSALPMETSTAVFPTATAPDSSIGVVPQTLRAGLQPLQGLTSNNQRHRQTLQVPKVHGSRSSTPGSGQETFSGRFSPTTSPPRHASVIQGRRTTRLIQPDHFGEIPPDEDAARWADAIKAKRASKRRREEDAEDKVVVGTKVDHNHVNWVTAYNMLTGIRFVVSRINAKMDRPLTDTDFDAKHKFSFDITGNELTPSAKYDFKFKDYSPWVFRHLRCTFGLDPADYLMSLTSKYILSELGSPGKSGSFFYFSRDYKYIIKTIHHGEHKFLRHILRDYYKHVEENPNTLISQYYGLHRVKTPFGRKIHFVVMNNLFPPHRDIHQTFDLKGSTIGRDCREENLSENPRATLKDLNWLRRNMHLNFGPQKRNLFVQQVDRDVRLLQKLEIMDYSLLIGIHDLTRGNKDDIRNNQLKVFQPGGAENDDLHGHILQRTPSKMEKARQARELRKMINREVPVSLDRTSDRLPEEFMEQRKTLFYGDDGGFRATHETDEPGEVIYYLGIIDCLTHYGFVKKFEHFWRGLSNSKEHISAIPPVGYGDRFFKFISRLIKSPEEATRESIGNEARSVLGTNNARVSNELVERAQKRAEECTKEIKKVDNRPVRAIVPTLSPSSDRSGDLSGTILPVVEEVGEGSSSSGARSRSSGGESGYAERIITTSEPIQSDAGVDSHTTITPISFSKQNTEELAIRIAHVSS